MIKLVEWFGGIGAATQAMKRLQDHQTTQYIELDKHAVKSFNAINGTNFVPTDINDVNVNEIGEIDVLIAGWPCQDYSIAGLGKGLEGTRSSLILLTIDKIRQMKVRPKYILLENVKGLLSKKHKEDLAFIKELFEELGYVWDQALLNSKYFGVPQSRERVFIALSRHDMSKWNIKHLEERNTVDKVLKDVLDFNLPTQQIKIETLLEANYGKGVKMEYENYIYLPPKDTSKPLNNLEGRRLWKTDKYVGTIPAGQPPKIYFKNTMKQYNGKDIELDIDKLRNQQKDKINKVATLGVLNGIDFKNKILYDLETTIHYRKLSTLECWRLMGFNDEAHNKCKEAGVSDSQLAKQAGNSIVVNVLEALFKELPILKGNNNE